MLNIWCGVTVWGKRDSSFDHVWEAKSGGVVWVQVHLQELRHFKPSQPSLTSLTGSELTNRPLCCMWLDRCTGQIKQDISPPGRGRPCRGWTGCGWCCSGPAAPCPEHLPIRKEPKKIISHVPFVQSEITSCSSHLNKESSTWQQPPPHQISPKQIWPEGFKVLLLFWTERKTGKPVSLKQSSSLAQSKKQ